MEQVAMEKICVEKCDFEDILIDRTNLPIIAVEWQEKFRRIIKAGGCIWLLEPDGTVGHKATLNAEGQLGSVPIT